MTTILYAAIVLSVLILIHEFGHFIAAKLSGIKVEEFGLGLPPRIAKIFSDKETEYTLNSLPIGGFVRLHGENFTGNEQDQSAIDKSKSFFHKSVFQRGFVLTAGIIMNYLLGLILISIIVTWLGIPQFGSALRVESIQENSPASSSELAPEDIVVGYRTNQEQTFSPIIDGVTFKESIEEHKGTRVDLSVIKSSELSTGNETTITVTPRENPPENQGAIGFVYTTIPFIKYSQVAWTQIPEQSFLLSIKFIGLMFQGLKMMLQDLFISGTIPQDVAGPFGLAVIIGESAKQGIFPLIQITALISINLAVVNILPIPALDGGRIVFVVWEGITGKKINPRYEMWIHAAGMVLLLTLLAIISLNDIKRFF